MGRFSSSGNYKGLTPSTSSKRDSMWCYGIQPSIASKYSLTERIVRSADHKWAMLPDNPLYLYSSDADSFTTIPLGAAANFVIGYALNSDGSKIAVFTAQQIIFMSSATVSPALLPFPLVDSRCLLLLSAARRSRFN